MTLGYRVELLKSASKQLLSFPKKTRERLLVALDELAAEPRAHGIIKLTPPELGYRMRVGDMRIKFAILDAEKRIVVREVVDRRDAY